MFPTYIRTYTPFQTAKSVLNFSPIRFQIDFEWDLQTKYKGITNGFTIKIVQYDRSQYDKRNVVCAKLYKYFKQNQFNTVLF